jgi:hypothetical protein
MKLSEVTNTWLVGYDINHGDFAYLIHKHVIIGDGTNILFDEIV